MGIDGNELLKHASPAVRKLNPDTGDPEPRGSQHAAQGRSGATNAPKPEAKYTRGGDRPPVSKFKNKPTHYDGQRYDSKAEAAYAEELDTLKRAGAVLHWEAQPTFLLVPGHLSGFVLKREAELLSYRPDFLVWARATVIPTGEQTVGCYAVDVKGITKQRDRDIWKLWKDHGPVPLKIVMRKDADSFIVPAGLPRDIKLPD